MRIAVPDPEYHGTAVSFSSFLAGKGVGGLG
jgi:hypothetical protein